MKKIIVSLLTICLCLCIYPRSYAQDRDFWQTTYGSWVYWSDIQNSSTQSNGYHEIGISIGDMSFPILNNDKFIVVEYQFKQPYSGSLGIVFNYNVSPMFKFASGDIAYYDYTNSNTVYVGLYHCTYFYLVLVGSPSNFVSGDLSVNSISYNITPDTDNNVVIDYTNKLNDINNMLGYINTSLDNIENYTDNVESYINSIEPILETISSTLSNFYSSSSTFYGQALTNLNSVVSHLSNIYTKVNSIDLNVSDIESVLRTVNTSLTTILNVLSNADLDNSDVISAINNLSQTRLSVNTYDIPFYQFMFINTLTRGDLSLVHFNEYNMPYLIYGEIKNIQKDFFGTGDMYMAYGLSAYKLEFNIDNGTPTTVTSVQGLFNRNIFTYLGGFNVTGWTTLSFDYGDSTKIYPLYLGRASGLPIEVSQALGRPYNDTYTQYLSDNISVLNSIYSYLSSLNIGDDSALITALQDLQNAINQLSGSFNVTNNVTVNEYEYSEQQYQFINMLLNGDYSKVRFDTLGKPFIYASDVNAATKRYYFSNSKPIAFIYATSIYMSSALLTESSITPGVSQGGFSNTYYIYLEKISSSGWKTFTLNYPQNYKIYPIYLGYVDNAPEYIRAMFPTVFPSVTNIVNNIYNELIGLSDDVNSLSNSTYFSNVLNKLDDVIDSINSLDLNFNVEISNQQITNITNDFDTNIEIVNNVEVDFNTSFEDTNELITDTDLTLDFDGLLSGIDVYHSIFSHFYNYSFFKYICIVCLVGGVILVLLG